MYYCCSTSGSAQHPISLPLESPFYLIAYGTRTCQAVKGAKSTLEYIYYETEIFTLMSMDDYGGAHPYGVAKGGKGHVIFYCYYTRKYRLKKKKKKLMASTNWIYFPVNTIKRSYVQGTPGHRTGRIDYLPGPILIRTSMWYLKTPFF